MRGITMDQSLSIILNTFKKAEEMEAYALAAIVLDAGGRVKPPPPPDGVPVRRLVPSPSSPTPASSSSSTSSSSSSLCT